MHTLDYLQYAKTARQLGADSCVLLTNKNAVLPVKPDEKIALFGRCQFETYASGTGSGGMVNLPYLVTIKEGLEKKRDVDGDISDFYANFIKENPFDKGDGWAKEPWSQTEPVLTAEQVKKASEKNDVGIFIVGRLAGEDKDASAVAGSYFLTDAEKENIRLITQHFTKSVVVLNVGGVVDMSWTTEIPPSAILYCWHCGSESGNAYADVLCGTVNPSGSLVNTIAKNLADYPSSENFGDPHKNIYKEDIYVGYRYFETFAQDKVLFPFGFGLSYTQFTIKTATVSENNCDLEITAHVENIGSFSGKKSLQVYIQCPNGKLGKPAKVLAGFAKTEEIQPNFSCAVNIKITKDRYASFDDEISAFILEQGEYIVHLGFDVRNTEVIGSFTLNNNVVVKQCTPALAPMEKFDHLVALEENGCKKQGYKTAITRNYSTNKIIEDEPITPIPHTENKYSFNDLISGEITMDQFIGELTDFECICLARGEGMCSPKVTPGTAGCFGGVTPSLAEKDIPIACCSDGPSGIRMDNGTMAFSIPNGTAIGCTFDTQLCNEIFSFVGMELVKNKIDTLLGPGINIHRHPLCGRNFEYCSEDPILTGEMAVAELTAFHKFGVTGTIKHFACNNQETGRRTADSVLTARALREIYLKAFEMAVTEGSAYSIMTAYNPINGIQAASNFDLNTQILRKDWGYNGVVMTDWWATMNTENGAEASITQTSAMIKSQNDVFMVNADALTNSSNDDSESSLANGSLNTSQLQRGAKNILSTLCRLNCGGTPPEIEVKNLPETTALPTKELGVVDVPAGDTLPTSQVDTTKGVLNQFVLKVGEYGNYRLKFDLTANAVELAQIAMTVTINRFENHTNTLQGGLSKEAYIDFGVYTSINTYIDIFFSETGMAINNLTLEKR